MTIGSCIVGIQLCCCNIQVYGKKLSKALRHSAKKPRFSVHWSKIPHLKYLRYFFWPWTFTDYNLTDTIMIRCIDLI